MQNIIKTSKVTSNVRASSISRKKVRQKRYVATRKTNENVGLVGLCEKRHAQYGAVLRSIATAGSGFIHFRGHLQSGGVDRGQGQTMTVARRSWYQHSASGLNSMT